MTIKSPAPLISIALCTYQAESFLSTQLDSLLSQSYPSVEIHIFDDCSSDSTLAIISRYLKRHTNIFLRINKSRLGFVKNFEQAITVLSLKGGYIALCDQDDIWHSNKLASCLSALKLLEQAHPNKPVLVHSDLRMVDNNGKCKHPSFFEHKHIELPAEKSLAKILGYNGVMGNTILMNNKLAQLALPFPATLKYHDYWLALVNETFGVRATLNEQLIDYRIHNHNASDNRLSKPIKKRSSLPFMEDSREKTLAYFLCHYEVEKKDKEVITAFYYYLCLKKSRVSLVFLLLKYEFLRNNWRYRFRVFRRLLFGLR